MSCVGRFIPPGISAIAPSVVRLGADRFMGNFPKLHYAALFSRHRYRWPVHCYHRQRRRGNRAFTALLSIYAIRRLSATESWECAALCHCGSGRANKNPDWLILGRAAHPLVSALAPLLLAGKRPVPPDPTGIRTSLQLAENETSLFLPCIDEVCEACSQAGPCRCRAPCGRTPQWEPGSGVLNHWS